MALVSKLHVRCPWNYSRKGTIQEGSCSVANTELIGAAHQGRSRRVPARRKFAEREFHNSTAQCLHPLKMPPSVAAAEMHHEILCAVIQEK